jgi:peptide/nickel transport system permease protein
MSAAVGPAAGGIEDAQSPSRGGRRRMHPTVFFFARRLLQGVVTLVVASILVFLSVQALPGNVATLVLGRSATPARVAAIENSLHLHQSLPRRYWTFADGLLHGHLGDSTASLAQGEHVSVGTVIGKPLRNSLILAGITLVLFLPLCALLGTAAALRSGKWLDRTISGASLAAGALPEFLVGTLLVLVFFSVFNLLPPVSTIPPGGNPLQHLASLWLPVFTLLSVSLAFGTRLLRASMIETLNLDYVAMARLRGLGERRVIVRYVLRNSLAPSVQVAAQMAQWLIGGIIVTESVFNYPGIGTELVNAVSVEDIQVLMVVATLLAAIYILINVLADFAVVVVVPKLRTAA